MKILAMNSLKANNTDIQILVDAHNSAADGYYAFEGLMTRDRAASIIGTLDSALAELLRSNDIGTMIYTDTVATVVSKLTAKLCGKELSDISFAALRQNYPDAYAYIESLVNSGNTWDAVDVIPFGITAGDKEAFIKACGAGAEHFGDVLALSIIIAPTAYEEALMPLLEALHTGAMPSLEEFIGQQGLDSAKRMEIITEKVLTIIEPVSQAPLSYILEILPELIYSYNMAAQCFKNYPDLAKTGLSLPPINELLAWVSGEFGLAIPEYDLSGIILLSTATAGQSGDRTGKRLELTGDKEAVFAALAGYIADIISLEDNVSAISNIADELLGISPALIKPILTLAKALLS